MPICHKKQFIFFHIPRCGGTSVEYSLQLNTSESLYGVEHVGERVFTLHHMTAADLLLAGKIDPAMLRTYFTFTVIRDPFDRMASDFYWQKYRDAHGEFGHLSFAAYLDKAEAIVREQRYFEKIHYDHFRPMTDYCVQDGVLLVNDILRLEFIDRELHRLHDRLGQIDLQHLNHIRAYDDLRTAENLARVYDLYACDKLLYDNITTLRPAN